MDLIWQKFTEWLKEMLVSGIMDNVNGMFNYVNGRVAEIAGQVGATPQGWNSGIYNMIRTLSDNVILPIAGVILAFVMTLELIQLITEKNNMHDVDTWMFFKWIFKTACAVLIVTNTWNIECIECIQAKEREWTTWNLRLSIRFYAESLIVRNPRILKLRRHTQY